MFDSLLALDREQPGFLREIVAEFEETVRPRLDAIREAALAGHPRELETVAHSVRGTSATLGARRLAAVAGSLEAIGRSGRIEGSRELLPMLAAEYGAFRRALEVALAA